MGDWCTIESDPGVFTELIRQIGVKGIQVQEVYSIDSLQEIKPVYGLIFLFKWVPGPERECLQIYDPSLFFANQIIQNACATQALLSILLNSSVDIGPELNRLKQFGLPLDPKMRGLAISNSDVIREAHNSFSHQEPFELGKAIATEKDDVYHFVSYVPFNGVLYELDGMQKGPIKLAECSDDDWLQKVKPSIFERIEKYSENEIRFNLLALVKSRKQNIEQRLAQLQVHSITIQTKLRSLGEEPQSQQMEIELDQEYFNSIPDTPQSLYSLLDSVRAQVATQNQLLLAEEEKYRKWREENARRRHNYIPFVLTLLEKLAQKNQLIPLLEQAKKRKADKQAEKEKGKQNY